MSEPLLAIDDLHVSLRSDRGTVEAVNGVDFSVDTSKTVCLLGESGCGKTVTCETITGLNAGILESVSGAISFDGIDLVSASERTLRSIRGDRIAHVFQNPESALDPVYTVGDQVIEALRAHRDIDATTARSRASELLERVGIPRAHERVDDYPHQFSTGMCQRVAIAIALAAEPELLIADEPTASLDVTVQARILKLLATLQAETGCAMLLVTHDLRVVSAMADDIVVVHDGITAERGPVGSIFERPAHPYTQALFRAASPGLGEVDGFADTRSGDDAGVASGCRYAPDCPHTVDACTTDPPPLHPVGDLENHEAACVYFGNGHDERVVLEGSVGIGEPRTGDRHE